MLDFEKFFKHFVGMEKTANYKASTCWKLLGIKPNSSDGEIKRAYRRLAQKWHPDRNGGNEQQAADEFIRIKTAYEILSTKELRQSAEDQDDAGKTGVGEFVKSGFRKASQYMKKEKKQGADVHVQVEIEFNESLIGTKRSASFWRATLCTDCLGQRGAGGWAPAKCGYCSGIGKSVGGLFKRSCVRCQGTGINPSSLCVGCGGTGLMKEEKLIELKIPPAVADGVRLKIVGLGHYRCDSSTPGDFVATVHVKPSSLYLRKDLDLHQIYCIDSLLALVGGEIELNDAYGAPHKIGIKEGAQNEDIYIISKAGVKKSGIQGDLILELLLVSKPLTPELKEQIRTVLLKKRTPSN